MVNWYCVRDKRKTPNVPGEDQVCGLWNNKNPLSSKKGVGKLAGPSRAEGNSHLKVGDGIGKDISGTAMDLFLHHGVPYLAKKGVEMGRYYASEAMRNPQLQKKAINYGVRKATPVLQKVGSELLDQLSTKVRPNIRYKTDRPDLDGRGIPVPFPFVDFKKLGDVVSNPKPFKGPEVSAKEGWAMVAEYKRQYADYKKRGGSRNYGSWVKWMGYGRGLFDPRFVSQGVLVPKFATDTKFSAKPSPNTAFSWMF